MEHMDEYTILYQAKNYITTDREIREFVEKSMGIEADTLIKCIESDSEMIRQLALKWLELGMKELRYEYPPNVSRRMEKYYNNNKNYLAQALAPHIRQVITGYTTSKH